MRSRPPALASLVLLLSLAAGSAHASGFGLPSNRAGLGFGNLERFDGVRLNLRDRGVDRVRGVNCTFWFASRNDGSDYLGISIGPAPSGGRLRGVQLGLLGAGADKGLSGVSAAGLGVGVGLDAHGVQLGGLGCGAGRDLKGIAIGGLGCGAGEDLTGIAIGGLGGGAGKNLTGIAIGGLGCGAGEDLRGIAVGGLGCGAGKDLNGVAVGGLGVAAGRRARGILLAGLRAEAGSARGVLLAAHTRIRPDGRLSGAAAGLWNQVRGSQTGLSVGLFNYARDLRGLQLGAINWVRDNPAWRRVLPLVNW